MLGVCIEKNVACNFNLAYIEEEDLLVMIIIRWAVFVDMMSVYS